MGVRGRHGMTTLTAGGGRSGRATRNPTRAVGFIQPTNWDELDEDISVEGLLLGIGDRTKPTIKAKK
jgi:hypothetical protein